jgi:O-acetyl-ADP-ribose deacetylase (regulator of RNase III)
VNGGTRFQTPRSAARAFARIECVIGDLTLERVDAIVNAANSALRGGGGVDGAIHRAAGPGLLEECERRFPEGCPTGDARMTSGYALPAKWVIHAVGPVYRGGNHGEASQLAAAHLRSLELADERGLATLAFPAISCGVYGYPWPEAAEVAISSVASELAERPEIERVRFVLASEGIHAVFEETLARLTLG